MDKKTITLILKEPLSLMTSSERFHKITKLELRRRYDIDTDENGNCIIAVPLLGENLFMWIAIEGNQSEIEKEMAETFSENL